MMLGWPRFKLQYCIRSTLALPIFADGCRRFALPLLLLADDPFISQLGEVASIIQGVVLPLGLAQRMWDHGFDIQCIDGFASL